MTRRISVGKRGGQPSGPYFSSDGAEGAGCPDVRDHGLNFPDAAIFSMVDAKGLEPLTPSV